jgi:transposase-like protein
MRRLAALASADETFIGGHDRRGFDDKHVVLGAVERGGEVQTKVIDSRHFRNVVGGVSGMLAKGARVVTDDYVAYTALAALGHPHAAINHSSGEWVRGPVHTNTIEAFWAQLKRRINGTYIHVSKKHLPKYLGEFEYRFNLRKSPYVMFQILTLTFRRPSQAPWSV